VRAAFEKLPWVRTVSVRRHFPWQLEVSLEEHVALAHWNGSKLVNTYGEVFAAETKQMLPGFIGQPDSAAEVTQMYVAFGKQLMPLGQAIAQISLSPRRAWQLRLDSGMVLELGREQSEQRLANFVAVYPYSLATMGRRINYVDLRYRNGFAAYLPGGVSAPDGQGKHGENAGNQHSKV
jgi:cell division protein FtsQ